MPDRSQRLIASRGLLAACFYAAGVLHFVHPAPFVDIIPPFLPAPRALVFISGACEIAGGIGILLPYWRRWAGYGLIALLIAVYPANIYMLLKQWQAHGWTLFTFLLVLRLPLQFLLIAWVRVVAKGVGDRA